MLMVSRSLMVAALVILAVLVSAGAGEAQTFTFRLGDENSGLCNKVTLTFVPTPASNVLSVFGYDDNCGESPRRAPIHGTAVLNTDGSATIGYTTILPFSVYERTDVGLQTSVEWPAGADSGIWHDDDGETGPFIFNLLDQKSG